MTDKQIIIDGVDVSGCPYYCGHDICKNTCHYFCTPCEWVQIQNCMYKYGKRKEQECEELKDIIETKLEDANICDSALNYINDEYIYVKRQLDQLKAENEELKDKLNCCFCNPYVELNNIEKQRKCIEVTECFRRRIDQLKAENEELKKIINEAKNSKLDLKSFLVGEAIQNEYEQQLDQLKAENEELKKIIERLDVPKHEVIDMDIALENEKLKQTLTEIKEIAESQIKAEENNKYKTNGYIVALDILQKISECEVTNE